MLDGVDDVDWAALSGGDRDSDRGIPGLLRGLLSDDPVVFDASFDELLELSRVNSFVDETSAALMPFLVDVCLEAGQRRADLLLWTGVLVDDAHTLGVEATRATFRPHAARLTPLLADPDARVRAAAAYALRQGGDAYPAVALWERWSVEDDREVRDSLLLALVERDPNRAGAVARELLRDGDPNQRLAAAVALYRAGLESGSNVLGPIAAAQREGGRIAEHWCHYPDDLVDAIEDAEADLDNRV